MKKILFATDAMQLNRQSLEFACYLSNLTHAELTGVLLESIQLKNTAAGSELKDIEGDGDTYLYNAISASMETCCEENIRLFKEVCASKGIICKLQGDKGVTLETLIRESRYADLIVADVAATFSWKREDIPTRFIKEMIIAAECPVITAPSRFEGIDEIIFTYDESRSAVFAIKQFTYLFPELHTCKATILNVSVPGKLPVDNELKLKEWLQMHYSHIDTQTLEEEHETSRLLGQLLGETKVFIVMGAFGRSRLSGMFMPSHATPVIKMVSQPVFICHL